MMSRNTIYSNYFIGICWFLLSLLISNLNDVAMKFLGDSIPSTEIVFLRYSFGSLSLVPVIWFQGTNCLKSEKPSLHILRGLILFIAITTWCNGLNSVPISHATLINFSVPLFTLILARIVLKESLGWQKTLATFIGFLGILVVNFPTDLSFNFNALVLIFSAFLFANLDIINKKFVLKENLIAMIFYSTVIVTFIAGLFSIQIWKTPSLFEFFILAILGIGSNLILYCTLRAFKLVQASSLAPFRYVELLFSVFFGYIIFAEIPGLLLAFGTLFIFLSLFIVSKSKTVQTKQLIT